jgi:predicted dehydrogenase
MSNSHLNKVLIVGLGKIGMGYDLNLDVDNFILTHARAFSRHENFELVAGVDSNRDLGKAFESYYNRKSYTDLLVAIRETNPSIVVVATPTETHYAVITSILNEFAPNVIVCEKPIAFDLKQAQEIVFRCKDVNCHLYVNYMRCSDVGVAEIQRQIRIGLIESPIKGVVWYSKGLFNSASHFINLLEFLLGNVRSVQLINKGRLWNKVDPEPDFILFFDTGSVHFVALKAENYFHNAMELSAQNGRLRYERGGEDIYWNTVKANDVFSGYYSLNIEAEKLDSDFFRVQWHVVDQLHKSINLVSARICRGDDALRTLDTLVKIKGLL